MEMYMLFLFSLDFSLLVSSLAFGDDDRSSLISFKCAHSSWLIGRSSTYKRRETKREQRKNQELFMIRKDSTWTTNDQAD